MKITITQAAIDAALEAYRQSFLETAMLSEGVYDPGILKCVFLAGGPGSGKSYTAAELFGIDQRFKASFSTYGLKVVSSDIAFEFTMKKNGIDPGALADIERNDPEMWDKLTSTARPDSLRNRAKKITDLQKRLYLQGRLGLIVDGTGENYEKTRKQRDDAIHYGYDTYMVFVHTSLETAIRRNNKRERKLPESLVQQLWNNAQTNLERFRQLFGSNFTVVNKDVDNAPVDSAVNKAIGAFIRKPIENPVGREWMQVALTYQSLAGTAGR